MHVANLFLKTYSTCNLEIGETINLSCTQQFAVKNVDACATLQLLINIDDMLELLKEPLVNLSEVVNLVNCVTTVHSLRNHEHTLICRLTKSSIDIFNLKFLVLNETVHALTDHTKTLLKSLLEVATNSHNFTYRLHA